MQLLSLLAFIFFSNSYFLDLIAETAKIAKINVAQNIEKYANETIFPLVNVPTRI